MSSRSPRISVIVPAYNEANYLSRCLSSLKRQRTKTPYEIIVVDNNSTDSTAKIAKRFGVRVVNEKIPGVCAARQRGLKNAKGSIIVSTDADANFPIDWLTRIETVLTSDQAVVGVGGAIRYVDAPRWAPFWTGGLFGASYLSYRIFSQPFYISACNLAFKRSAFHGYNLKLNQGGDELEVLRQLRQRGTVVFDLNNVVETSSRRLKKGFVYNVFITFFLYYLLGYSLSQITKRRILASYPAIRTIPTAPQISPLYLGILTAMCSLVLIRLGRTGHLHLPHTPGLHLPRRVTT